jgi:hypothetical protein
MQQKFKEIYKGCFYFCNLGNTSNVGHFPFGLIQTQRHFVYEVDLHDAVLLT